MFLKRSEDEKQVEVSLKKRTYQLLFLKWSEDETLVEVRFVEKGDDGVAAFNCLHIALS